MSELLAFHQTNVNNLMSRVGDVQRWNQVHKKIGYFSGFSTTTATTSLVAQLPTTPTACWFSSASTGSSHSSW